MEDIIKDIIIEFEETKDYFIYRTTYPYTQHITEQKLSKERLKKLILLGLEKEKEIESDKRKAKRMMLEKAKEIIKTYFKDANCGIFNSHNNAGDRMETIYEDEVLTIDICYGWSYFEVFGLSIEEFEELEKFYFSLPESGDKNEC